MPRLRPIHVAYALIGSFFVAERMLRQGQSAKSWQEGPEDKGSTRSVGAAFGRAIILLLAAPLLNRLRFGRAFSESASWVGVTAMLGGLALRIWSSRVLGAYYTRTLRTQEGQHIVTGGPYQLLRHPGYVGVILLWLGAGVASENVFVAAGISIPMVRAYMSRMDAEEAMLADSFPQEYPNYARRTWRLIPHIY